MSTLLQDNNTQLDIELLTFGYVIKNYKENVPMAIKFLIVNFTNKYFASMLSMKEDLILIDILQNNLSFYPKYIKHLFTASKNDYLAKKFHNACHENKEISDTITIIKSNFGNVFGGYTSKSWTCTKNDTAHACSDENAFLFLLRSKDIRIKENCPFIFHLKKDDRNYAIWRLKHAGPCFGDGYDILIGDKCDKKRRSYIGSKAYESVNFSNLTSYYNDQFPKGVSICGGNETEPYYRASVFEFDVIEYQVFAIIK